MNIVDVMDQLATQLDTIAGLRVSAYPPDSIHVPHAIVSWPDSYTFDGAMQRGMDRMNVPVVVLVQRTPDRVGRAALAAYCHGSGASSFKAVLEAGTYTAFHSARLESVAFDVIPYQGDEYWAATFSIDVVGSGA